MLHQLPKTQMKNLSKYTPKGKRNLFSVGKGTPSHVKSQMIMYNDALKHFNNHSSMNR